jgi:hypothetical protein
LTTEFCNLPDQDQEMLWRKNKINAAVIAVARINSVRTGLLKDNAKQLYFRNIKIFKTRPALMRWNVTKI